MEDEEDREKEEEAALDFLRKNIEPLSKDEFEERNFIAQKSNYVKSRPLMRFSNKVLAKTSIMIYVEAGRFPKKSDLEAFLNNNHFYRQHIFSTERSDVLDYWDRVNSEKGFPVYTIKEVIDIIIRTRAALHLSKQEVVERSKQLKQIESRMEERSHLKWYN